jgi:hypothetical protein
MKSRPAWSAVIFAALVVPSIGCHAADDLPNPEHTRVALAMLLGASNDLIPQKSTCKGSYGQPGPARIKDLLSTQLAYVYQGSSVIKGRCTDGRDQQCELSIARAAGEDVSLAKIEFAVRKGKVQAGSLHCEITP